MKSVHVILACLLLIFGNSVFWVQAEDVEQSGEKFAKLDSMGQELPKDAPNWAMVRDNTTGMIWEVKTADGSIHDMNAGYDWDGAQEIFIGQLNQMQFGGFTDWRLPTTDELRSIRVKGSEPYINRDFFPNTVPSSYMTWRKCGSGEIFNEKVKFGKTRNKKTNRQVRAVRGGNIQKVVKEK